MAKVKNPHSADKNDTDYMETNLKGGFTHIVKSKELKTRKRGKVTKKDEWRGFDGCSICQAMRSGTAGTVEGLKKAFDKANKK